MGTSSSPCFGGRLTWVVVVVLVCGCIVGGGGVYRNLKLYYSLNIFFHFSTVLCFGDANL